MCMCVCVAVNTLKPGTVNILKPGTAIISSDWLIVLIAGVSPLMGMRMSSVMSWLSSELYDTAG